jgi:hypothetical protein
MAAMLFGISLLVWHDFNVWQTADGVHVPLLRTVLLYVAAIAQMIGGLALLKYKTARTGAGLVLGVYTIFALLHLPSVVAHPLVYAPWGAFFEQVVLVAGGLLLLQQSQTTAIGLWLFRVCVVAFMLYQAFYIPETAVLVPKWIPLGQAFWAYATTAAFGLAAIALILQRLDNLAARLLTLMLALFQLLIWIPRLFANPHSHTVLAANAENLATVASAWIVAAYLARREVTSQFFDSLRPRVAAAHRPPA